MSRGVELAAPFSSRVRSRSPEPFERNVRQKITPPAISAARAQRDAAVAQRAADTVAGRLETPIVKREGEHVTAPRLEDILGDDAWAMDEDGDTAFTHVVVDQPEHPMYQRHVKRVLRTIIAYKEASEEKQCATKRLLTQCWLDQILQHIGEVMEASEQGDMSAESRMGHCRIQLKVVPIVEVENMGATIRDARGAAYDNESDSAHGSENGSQSEYNPESVADVDDSGIDLQRNDVPTPEDSDELVLNPASMSARDARIKNSANKTTHTSPVAGLAIERYMAFSHPSHRLLLRKIGHDTHGGPYRTTPKEDLKREICDWMARHQIAGNYLSFRKHCPDHWLVRFASEADANSLALERFDVAGASWQLEPFRNERWQVCVCKEVPKTVRYDFLFPRLSNAIGHFDDARNISFYAKKSRKKTQKHRAYACMVVMLNRPTDVKSFTIDCGVQLHFVAWLGDSMCPLCDEEHCVLTCHQFVAPNIGALPKPAAMTYERPPAMVRQGGLAWT